MAEKEKTTKSHDSSHKEKKEASGCCSSASGSGSSQAWMFTTIVLAVLLLLSMIWSGVLTMMLVDNSSGAVAAPTVEVRNAPSPTAPTPSPTAPTAAPTAEVSLDDDPVQGDPDAPITIVEFSDYECPFCARFFRDTHTQLKTDYIDTGKVKLVFRDFPLSFHARATPAAIAAECVDELADDETYFEMHDLIFENQGALSDADLRTYASRIGIDMDAYDECYADEDGSMAAEVQNDFRQGQAAGVSGTPTFFVNGQKLVGAQPYDAFKAIIDAELAK